MNKEKLQLSKKQAEDLLFRDSEDYKVIEKNFRVGGSSLFEFVIQRNSDKKYFKDSFRIKKGEDVWPYDDNEPNFTEVEKKEKIVFVYE